MAKATNAEKRVRREAKKLQVTELKNKINKIKSDNKIIYMETYDWKELSEEVYVSWEKSTKLLGGYFLSDPACHGSDCLMIVISNKEVNLDELKRLHDLENEIDEL